MDIEYRIKGKTKIADGKQFCSDSSNKNQEYHKTRKELGIYYVKDGINTMMQIVHKTVEDWTALFDASSELAIIFFNSNNYQEAAKFYSDGINYLLQIQNIRSLEDSDYRLLVKHYIDLSDACYYLYNNTAADEAVSNAIVAFNCIKFKDRAELALGDPASNFKAFHLYHENITSLPSYVGSTRFLNHQELLNESQMSIQEENELLNDFGNISMAEQEDIHLNIQSMIGCLNPLFKPVPLIPNDNDENCRQVACKLLNLAATYNKQGFINKTIDTFTQTLNALKSIQTPGEHDRNIIRDIRKHIGLLKQRVNTGESEISPAIPFPQHLVKQINPASYGGGFYSYRPQDDSNGDCDDLLLGYNV